MFMRRIDQHRRRAIHQVHSANLIGTRHWTRAVDRPRHDQEPNFKKKEAPRKLLGQQNMWQADRVKQRQGGAKTPAGHNLPTVNKGNPAPRKDVTKVARLRPEETRGSRHPDTPRPSPRSPRREQSRRDGIGGQRHGRPWTPARPIAASRQPNCQETTSTRAGRPQTTSHRQT